jgi:hypothetical protein
MSLESKTKNLVKGLKPSRQKIRFLTAFGLSAFLHAAPFADILVLLLR